MRKNRNDTGLEAIRIEGGLLSSSLLTLLRHYQLFGQTPEDYGIEKGLKLNDELGRYWRIAQARWQQFSDLNKRADLDHDAVAKENWLIPLFTRVLDFQVEESRTIHIGERTFPITHTAFNGAVPFVLTGPEHSLEKGDLHFGEEGRKRSPAGLLQEYVNAEDHCLWAIVSNGLVLRLLRDNPAMTRPAFIEVDLERIFDEELYVDFTVFWLLFQATRLAPIDEKPDRCLLEQWRSQGQSNGERVLGELRHGVTSALRILGTGFVSNPDNQELREAIKSEELTTDKFFQELLRLIYRFLFLFTTEDRDILLDPAASDQQKQLYQQGYSISVLRERSRFRRHYDNYGDGWQQLCITFSAFATGQPLLALPALGGLFANDQCPHLEQHQLANRYLYDALFKLCYFEIKSVLTRINYRDMGTEELGSVYESLLELIPKINVNGQWQFGFLGDEEGDDSTAGHARKLTGSYYTPDSLVQELIKSALEPVILDRLAENETNPREAILDISVCDPACGSGHFLLAAARRLAVELARIEAGTDQPTEANYRHALREVISRCIYGVDINPMAVELCRTALWLEAVEPGKPLSYLNHHIQCGNSLLGVTPALLAKGIPDSAFIELEGDDRAFCREWKRKNSADRAGQLSLFDYLPSSTVEKLNNISSCIMEIDLINDESMEGIKQKHDQFERCIHSEDYGYNLLLNDAWCASFVWKKKEDEKFRYPITEKVFREIEKNPEAIPPWLTNEINALRSQYNFFHWHLAYPDIFRLPLKGEKPENDLTGLSGGFDVVLGNPPWERVKLQEKEFFSGKDDKAFRAPNKSARERAIQALAKRNPKLLDQFYRAKRHAQGVSNLLRESARFPFCGRGDVNLYAVFAELNRSLKASNGYAGFIIQSDIATGDTYKLFFEDLLHKKQLVSFYDFQNKEKLFAGLDTRNPHFCLLTISPEGKSIETDFSFWNTNPSHLFEKERHFTMSSEDLERLNPNTKTCPIFRCNRDATITKRVYQNVPVLFRESEPDENSWGISLKRLFDMANDSGHFVSRQALAQESELESSVKETRSSNMHLRLYEGKMTWLFDHRWATYEGLEAAVRGATESEKQNVDWTVSPQYWVNKKVFQDFVERKCVCVDQSAWEREWFLGYRDVTNTTNERTVVASVIPKTPANHKYHVILLSKANVWAAPCLLANMNSLIFDFIARQKYSSTSLSDFFVKQFPTLPPDSYNEFTPWNRGSTLAQFIIPRVVELVYTSTDLRPFAEDFSYDGEPFVWDVDRRGKVRAELDALYFLLYGICLTEAEYIIDSFNRLRENEERNFGKFITKISVLSTYEDLLQSISDRSEFGSHSQVISGSH